MSADPRLLGGVLVVVAGIGSNIQPELRCVRLAVLSPERIRSRQAMVTRAGEHCMQCRDRAQTVGFAARHIHIQAARTGSRLYCMHGEQTAGRKPPFDEPRRLISRLPAEADGLYRPASVYVCFGSKFFSVQPSFKNASSIFASVSGIISPPSCLILFLVERYIVVLCYRVLPEFEHLRHRYPHLRTSRLPRSSALARRILDLNGQRLLGGKDSRFVF